MAAGSAAWFLSSLHGSNYLRPPGFAAAVPNALSTAVAPAPAPSFSSRPFFRHAPPRFCSPVECGDASHSLLTEKPWANNSGGSARAPTAPWMNQPLVIPPEDVPDLSRLARKKREVKPRGGSLTQKVRGGRSRQAMKKIVQSIARLGEKCPLDEDEEENGEESAAEGSRNFPLERVLGCSEEEGRSSGGGMPWVGTEKPMVFPRAKQPKVVTAAELTLPEALLTRLRMEARNLTKWVKAKKAGVTEDVVDEVRASWRKNELVMVKFVEPLCRNMDRAREIVEIKTGGLVVWSKRNALVVFRGKNSKLQGLAAAIMKLWEKSLIAKIAVKQGVHGTDDEQMANELKRLTGGIIILRNKYFIIFYRGKDFIPPMVANSIFDRERELKKLQLQEENARLKATETSSYGDGTVSSTSSSGTFKEFRDIKTNCWCFRNGNWEEKVKMEAEKEWLRKELGRQERKLQLLKLKVDKSEEELAKLNSKWRLSQQASDQEYLTEEERQAFRRVGLKMDEFLLLGRRGVYNGTIASIHMHWKHREIVKVITMQQKFSQITFTASLLEIESGGILVAIEKLRSGHTIIIYRGKNYQAPIKLLPENLLTKKEAFERSIQIQRRGSLKYFAQRRQQSIWELKMKLRALEKKLEQLDPGDYQSES